MNWRITPSSVRWVQRSATDLQKQDKAMRASFVLAVLVLGVFQASPSIAASSMPRPCYGDLIVYCPPTDQTTPKPKPSKPKPGTIKMDNEAIDAGMSEARDKADIA
jgi:hypothetical protein